MPEVDESEKEKQFYVDIPAKCEAFFLKGCNSVDWGMKNRLSKIFDPKSGKTVMLAIDHGYFQGPTTGLERVDVTILPLLPYADTLMLTRGILRTIIPPTFDKGIVLRASGGPSILSDLSNEQIAIDIDEAIRLNVAAMAVQVLASRTAPATSCSGTRPGGGRASQRAPRRRTSSRSPAGCSPAGGSWRPRRAP